MAVFASFQIAFIRINNLGYVIRTSLLFQDKNSDKMPILIFLGVLFKITKKLSRKLRPTLKEQPLYVKPDKSSFSSVCHPIINNTYLTVIN